MDAVSISVGREVKMEIPDDFLRYEEEVPLATERPLCYLRRNMRRLRILLGLMVVVLSTQNQVAAQGEPCEPRLLPISLVGPDATFLNGFGVSDIALKSHTFDVKGISIQPDSRLRRVVILLDLSSSMAGGSSQSTWNVVTEFVSHVAGVSATNTQFALVLFSDHILETIDFSRDRGAVHRRLQEISDDPEFRKRNVHGRTALFDALKTGFHLIGSPTSADSLFVITDGGDNVSKAHADEILKMLTPSMARVFALFFQHRDYMSSQTQEVSSSAKDFLELVYKSGGSAFGPIIIDQTGHFVLGNLDLLNRSISEELIEFYKSMLENPVLTVQTTPASENATSLDIALSREGRKHWKHASLLYPHQIGTCSMSTAKKD